jgi:polyvinyl alcohol dehydrogenase (cytochrome)
MRRSRRPVRSRTPLALVAAAVALSATAASATPGQGHGHDRPCRARHRAGGEWRGYGNDPGQSRTQPAEHLVGTAQASSLAPAWTFDVGSVGDAGQFDSTPVAAGGCVFAASTGGVVYALDAATGALVWRTPVHVTTPGLGGAIVSAVIAVDDLVMTVVNETGDGTVGPYVLALDASTGATAWRSAPLSSAVGYYSNASPAAFGGVVVAGFSPPEGQQVGQGGFVILDAATGATLRTTTTIPPADQARGYSGGGLWSTAAFDTATGYAYLGGGNPFSHSLEHPNTNAILKVDARRWSPSFGAIVGAYKGNADQYTDALTTLSHTPVCDATAPVDFALDDPACGQLDLDFGATPNVFTVGGRTVVGDLQKAGVYHVADAATMAPVWNTVVGASCFACNAASTAVAGGSVFGTATPGGVEFALSASDGARQWVAPVADGAHYESTSVANGVVYTVDGGGSFDAWDAATGTPLLHRSLTLDTGLPAGGLTSNGVSVAYHTVYVAADATGASAAGTADHGVVIAYRAA